MFKRLLNSLFKPEKTKSYKINIGWGEDIRQCIGHAIYIATASDSKIIFEFNGVTITIAKDSPAGLIYRDWNRAMNGYISSNVGPYPKKELSATEQERDAIIEADNERRRQESQKKYEVEAKAKREAVEAKLIDAPKMEFVDADAWIQLLELNQDPYGKGVVTYAERWARLMQMEIAQGKALKHVAGATSYEADLEGMSGFSYGMAVSILSKVWIHGDQLRRWHNLDTQIHHEGEDANESGETLNPALLTLGK